MLVCLTPNQSQVSHEQLLLVYMVYDASVVSSDDIITEHFNPHFIFHQHE